MLRRVLFWLCVNVSEEHTASIIMTEAWWSALLMEAEFSSETSQNTTRRKNPYDHLYSHRHKNLKSYSFNVNKSRNIYDRVILKP
jgi:hypothetical protein